MPVAPTAPQTAASASPPTAPPEPHAAPVSRPGGARPPGIRRLRDAARTEPGRLRVIGALLVLLLVLFGALSGWQLSARSAAADTVIKSSQPLSAHAAKIYRSLANANTTAATGFLAGATEPQSVRERYEKDIATAAELLATAAAHSGGSAQAQQYIDELNAGLPIYTGLVETARTNNRQGLPLGGAYLRYAGQKMTDTLLPAAEALYHLEIEQLRADHRDARAWPWLALTSGVVALAALGWVQRRHYLRTHRVFNRGLVTATVATSVLLLWLAGSHGFARASLERADRDGVQSLAALNEAWTAALQARGDEAMTLVARGSGQHFEESYQVHMAALRGAEANTSGGLLQTAFELAGDDIGRLPVREAIRSADAWDGRHTEAIKREKAGDYEMALALVTATRRSTGETFDRVNDSLDEAVQREQSQFDQAAKRGRDALEWVTPGALPLALIAAAGALLGIRSRLAEYP